MTGNPSSIHENTLSTIYRYAHCFAPVPSIILFDLWGQQLYVGAPHILSMLNTRVCLHLMAQMDGGYQDRTGTL